MDLSLLKLIDSDEIRSVFEKGMVFGGVVEVPTLCSNQTLMIDQLQMDRNGFLKIKLQMPLSVEKDRHLIVKMNYRDMIFSLTPKDYSIQGEVVTAMIPEKARALASRDTDRYALPLSHPILSSIYRIERRGEKQDLEAQLLDVSMRGLGLLLHHTEERTILKHDHLWIKTLNGILLEKPIFSKVIHVTHRKFRDDQMDSRIGIALESSLPYDILEELQSLSHLTLSA